MLLINDSVESNRIDVLLWIDDVFIVPFKSFKSVVSFISLLAVVLFINEEDVIEMFEYVL